MSLQGPGVNWTRYEAAEVEDVLKRLVAQICEDSAMKGLSKKRTRFTANEKAALALAFQTMSQEFPEASGNSIAAQKMQGHLQLKGAVAALQLRR